MIASGFSEAVAAHLLPGSAMAGDGTDSGPEGLPTEQASKADGSASSDVGAGRTRASAKQLITYAAYRAVRNALDSQGRLLSELFIEVPTKAEYPDYYRVIKKPIALQQIKERLKFNRYRTVEKFTDDIRQMFRNARLYNMEGSEVYQDAVELERRFDEAVAKASVRYQDGVLGDDISETAESLKKKRKMHPTDAVQSLATRSLPPAEPLRGSWEAYLWAARLIFENQSQPCPLHVKEITARALEVGLIKPIEGRAIETMRLLLSGNAEFYSPVKHVFGLQQWLADSALAEEFGVTKWGHGGQGGGSDSNDEADAESDDMEQGDEDDNEDGEGGDGARTTKQRAVKIDESIHLAGLHRTNHTSIDLAKIGRQDSDMLYLRRVMGIRESSRTGIEQMPPGSAPDPAAISGAVVASSSS